MKHKVTKSLFNYRYPWEAMGIGDWFKVSDVKPASLRRAANTAMKRHNMVFQLSATKTGIRVERVA